MRVTGSAISRDPGSARFSGKKVRLGVANQRVVVREIALPTMPEKELRQSLGFQVQEFIPMSAGCMT